MLESILSLMFPLHGLSSLNQNANDSNDDPEIAESLNFILNVGFSSVQRNLIIIGEDNMYSNSIFAIIIRLNYPYFFHFQVIEHQYYFKHVYLRL
jgi:hypothetical protein